MVAIEGGTPPPQKIRDSFHLPTVIPKSYSRGTKFSRVLLFQLWLRGRTPAPWFLVSMVAIEGRTPPSQKIRDSFHLPTVIPRSHIRGPKFSRVLLFQLWLRGRTPAPWFLAPIVVIEGRTTSSRKICDSFLPPTVVPRSHIRGAKFASVSSS